MEMLELSPINYHKLSNAIEVQRGLILVCACSGGGKTTTSRTMLLRVGKKAMSLEETQGYFSEPESIPVNSGIVVFGDDLRDGNRMAALVRYANQVLAIGVLRSGETGGALTRLVDFGVPARGLIAANPVVITQKLCRRLCVHCRAPARIDDNEILDLRLHPSDLSLMNGWIYEPRGCQACENGYRGRVPLIAVETFSELADVKGDTFEVKNPRRFVPPELRKDGVLKLVSGFTLIAELKRVMSGGTAEL